MSTVVQCGECGKRVRINPGSGRSVKCPACGEAIAVTDRPSEPEREAPEPRPSASPWPWLLAGLFLAVVVGAGFVALFGMMRANQQRAAEVARVESDYARMEAERAAMERAQAVAANDELKQRERIQDAATLELAKAQADQIEAYKKALDDVKAELNRLKAEMAKAPAPPPSPQPSSDPKPALTGPAALTGTWDIVTDGDFEFSFAGSTAQILMDEKIGQGNMLVRMPSRDGVAPGLVFHYLINKVDASKNPKSIVLISTLEGKDLLGIYELGGRVLRLAFAPAGKPAPTEYKYDKAKTNKVLTLMRVN